MPEIEVNEVSISSEVEEIKERNMDNSSSNEIEENPSSSDPTEEPKEEWLDVLGSGDLRMKTLVEGQPNTRPQTSDICTIHLKAELEDGTLIEEYEELVVEINGSEVVQGVDLVLSLLDIGQKVTAIVKPRFGYGTLGLAPNVPANATLVYTITMLKVDMAPELTNVPFEDRTKRALFKKDKGNWWYSRGDAHKAIQCYRPAIEILDESTSFTDASGNVTEMPSEIFQEFVKLKLVIYNNLAASQLMIDAYDSALMSVDQVIRLDPDNVKALFRKGKILAAKGNTDEAVEIFTKASLLEPENNAIKKELNAGLKRQASEKIQTKSLYRKMLGTEKKPEVNSTPLRPTPKGTSPFTKFLGGLACATVAAAVAYGAGFKYKTIAFWE